MDIAIDFPAVRSIVSAEHQLARSEISTLGPVRAYECSQNRHDERLAAATDVATLACKAGCYWCCYFSVDVRPVEVFRILEFMEQNLTSEERNRVRREVMANSAALRDLDELERMRRNIKCPFLSAGRCVIYPARPQTCRNYHATNVAGCQKSYDEPDNLEIDPEFAPMVYQAGGAHVEAFAKALLDEGYEITAYELNAALAAVMAQPAIARQRFEMREQPFAELPGTDAPFEFIDSDFDQRL
jgi:Fe-S-cluster containining protein